MSPKFYIILALASVGIGSLIFAQSTNSAKTESTNMNTWKTFQMPEYNLEFKYPPEGNLGDLIESLPGIISIDGLHRKPQTIKLEPIPAPKSLQGVTFGFSIRFIMLTDAAKMDTDYAKWYNWHETPTISMYPFDFNRGKDKLLLAIERLYLGSRMSWSSVEPISVDGKSGARMSAWDERLGNKDKFFHEIVGVPVSANKILIIQAGYFPQSGFLGSKSVKQLESKRQVFSNVVNSVKFLKSVEGVSSGERGQM